MLRMVTGSQADLAEQVRVRLEGRATPDKDERMLADTGLERRALERALRRRAGEETLRHARSFPARSLALDGLR